MPRKSPEAYRQEVIQENTIAYRTFYENLPIKLLTLMAEADELGVRYTVFTYKGILNVAFYRYDEYNDEEETVISLENLESTVVSFPKSGDSYYNQINKFEQVVDILTQKKAEKIRQEQLTALRLQAINKLNDDELTALKIHFRSMP